MDIPRQKILKIRYCPINQIIISLSQIHVHVLFAKSTTSTKVFRESVLLSNLQDNAGRHMRC